MNADPQKEEKFTATRSTRNKKCGQKSAVENAMWSWVLISASECTKYNHIFKFLKIGSHHTGKS
jgi:hypothetical protein